MIEKLLKIHRENEQLDFHSIWNEGLFVFDSNVLLDFYRLPLSARNDLMKVFEIDGFKERIWIAFQVALEFLNNRYEAIGDQKAKFITVASILEDTIEQYEALIQNMSSDLSKLKLKQRHSLIDPDKFITDENNRNGIKHLNEFKLELEKLEKEQSDVNDHDDIKDFVFKVFKEKIGQGFDKSCLEGIYKEGEKRYENDIPPGYKDKKKEGEYYFEDKIYVRKFGDLILWKEVLEKAKNDKCKHVVLVTGDIKEDWWQEKRGKKLGPRKELLNEIYTHCPDLETFYMYDTSSFLQYAKSTLNLDIKDSSISEAKDFIDFIVESRNEEERGLVSISELIRTTSNKFNKLKVGIGSSVKSLPPIKVDKNAMYAALAELFSNVIHHGRDKYVGIQAKETESMILIRFKNLKADTSSEFSPSSLTESGSLRGFGLEFVSKTLSKDNIDVHFKEEGKRFVVEMFIPKAYQNLL